MDQIRILDFTIDKSMILPYFLGAMVAGMIILLIASLISALWLRLSAAFLSIPDASYGRCYQASVLANFATAMLFLCLGWIIVFHDSGFSLGRLNLDLRRVLDRAMHAWLWYPILTTLVHAFIYAPVFRDMQDRPLAFTSSCGLTLVYFTICTFVGILVSVILAFTLPDSVLNRVR